MAHATQVLDREAAEGIVEEACARLGKQPAGLGRLVDVVATGEMQSIVAHVKSMIGVSNMDKVVFLTGLRKAFKKKVEERDSMAVEEPVGVETRSRKRKRRL